MGADGLDRTYDGGGGANALARRTEVPCFKVGAEKTAATARSSGWGSLGSACTRT